MNAKWFWWALIAEAVMADVWLARQQRPLLSTVARQSIVGKLVAVGITAHLCATIPHDPITALGKRMIRVGEQGREIVTLPSGSKVQSR